MLLKKVHCMHMYDAPAVRKFSLTYQPHTWMKPRMNLKKKQVEYDAPSPGSAEYIGNKLCINWTSAISSSPYDKYL